MKFQFGCSLIPLFSLALIPLTLGHTLSRWSIATNILNVVGQIEPVNFGIGVLKLP